ncbi:MAG: BBP7 family outer membrane beta-barrel protein [Planctomycetota bacterium]|nr:BBP7 family outer membrane beta-barrel protein [Planctomycetota bacterium]
MQFRIRVPIILGLLMACCHSSVLAQINSGYFPDGAASYAGEPFYDPGGLEMGCFRDPGPCWLGQATFDILLFDRSDADSRTIVTEVGTGNPLLNATDLGFPLTAAFRFNLVLTGDDGCDLVFNYLGARFDNSRTHSAATAFYDYFEFPSVTPSTGTSFQTSYLSTLSSVEFNGRTRQWSRFAPLAGVRFIQLEDRFDRLAGDASAQLQTSMADNELWGFQIGGEALLWDTGPVGLQSTIKGGVFYNDLQLRTGGGDITITDPVTMATTTVDPTASFSGDHVAFFGEVNLEFAYQICPQFSIRVGYTAMWMDGVALAPDQHDDFSIQLGFGAFDYGTVLYHGSYVGAELTW